MNLWITTTKKKNKNNEIIASVEHNTEKELKIKKRSWQIMQQFTSFKIFPTIISQNKT